MSENRVLRRIFGPKREEVVGACKRRIMRSFIALTFKKYYYGIKSLEDEMGRECSMDRRYKECM
jgi:hypothetical protein